MAIDKINDPKKGTRAHVAADACCTPAQNAAFNKMVTKLVDSLRFASRAEILRTIENENSKIQADTTLRDSIGARNASNLMKIVLERLKP